MKHTTYLLIVFISCFFYSCNSSLESGNSRLTATLNGENWEFFDTSVSRAGDELEITGLGYLGGDETTEPVNLQITIIGLSEQEELSAPLEVSFAPNTQGIAATATIIPADRPMVFDTQLDPNADGKIVITEVDENSISGNFNFIATDNGGTSLEVTDGSFNELPY